MISRKTIILVFACTAVFFEALDIAIINLAMPMIQKQFQVSNDNVHWAQTLYILLYGGFLIAGGKLADLYGRKRMFMIGAGLFLFTSLGAGLSPDFYFLIGFRALQGLAAAIVMPAALAIITNTFTDAQERSRAIGIFSSFAAIGSGCGLSLGGILATSVGWQWIFFINVPVITAVLWIGQVFVEKDVPQRSNEKIDILSGIVLTLVLVMLSYVVHLFSDFQSNGELLVVLLAGIFFGAFVIIRRSRHRLNPLINAEILQNSSTLTGVIVIAFLGAFFTSYLFIISIVFQSNMQYSAASTGLLLFPFSILSALTGKYMMPYLLRKYSSLRCAIFGMLFMFLGALFLLIGIQFNHALFLILLSAACITGLGIAISFTSLMVMSVHSIPDEHHGVATGMVSTASFMGGGLGMSILSLFMASANSVIKINSIPVIVLTFYAITAVLILMGVARMNSIPKSSYGFISE